MDLAQVIQLINSNIIPNGNNEITANVLRHTLIEMLQQPNDLIGDLGDLSTIDNDNLVNALNSLKDEVDVLQQLDFVDYKGTVDNYGELAGLTDLEIGDAYVNAEDGLVYVWNGTSFPADGDGMDVSMKPIGVVEEGNEFAVSGGEVYSKTVVNEFGQPVEVIGGEPYEDLPILSTPDGDFNFNQEYFLVNEFHRPDLSNYNVFIDAEDRVISYDLITAISDNTTDVSFVDLYYNPAEQEAYNIGSSGTEWVSAELYHELWEPFLNDTSYVSRELLGVSTEDQLNIYKYEFKPENPTRKAVIFGGNHGSEKIPPIVLYRFFKNLIENYSSSPSLQWARKNIHFVVVPLLSPDSYQRRTRRVKETPPFNASWTKSGTTATVTFNEADFPNNNPNLTASTYFSNDGIVGKTMVSLINSSDQLGVPDNGYLIQSNPNGRTVTINVPEGGSSSGTCEIYISTDPNRNYTMAGNSWEDYTPSGSLTSYTELVSVRNDNKGTKAYSLQEAKFAKQVIDENSDAAFLIDFHNGSGDYDTRWSSLEFNRNGIDGINDLHRYYTDVFLDRITTSNGLAPYATKEHNMNGLTVEWGQHSPITSKIATDSQRWFGNLMISGSWFYNEKI